MKKSEALTRLKQIRNWFETVCKESSEELDSFLTLKTKSSLHYDVKSFLEALDIAISSIEEVIKHEETFEWCKDCKEYDTETNSCHRWNKCIQETIQELNSYHSEESNENKM